MFGLRLTTDCAAAHEEGPTGPQRDRQVSTSSIQLCVAMSNQPSRWPNIASTVTISRQRQRPPEAPLEVHQFRVLGLVQIGQHRLQRHAALRAVARMVLADLRVHRAGVDRARRGVCGRGGGRGHRRGSSGLQVLPRLGAELRQALRAAEVVGPAVVFGVVRRLFGHRHAAHRILQFGSAGWQLRMRVRMRVPMIFMAGVGVHVHGSYLPIGR